MSTGLEIGVNVFFFVGAAVALGYAIHLTRRSRQWWPIYLFVAGGLCIFYEVLGDLLGEATYGEERMPSIYHFWGRHIPLYDVGVYFFYFGIVAVFFMQVMRRGLRRNEYWMLFAGHVVFCALFEQIPIHIGMWRYWGHNQPINVFGFPAWWWFANSSMILNATAAVYLLHRHVLRDRHAWAIMVAYPMAVVAVHASSALPVALALNSTQNRVLTNVGSVITIGVAIFYTWCFGRALELSAAVTHPAPGTAVEPAPREPAMEVSLA